jgi:hydroxymethylglutaryl-CoA reductase
MKKRGTSRIKDFYKLSIHDRKLVIASRIGVEASRLLDQSASVELLDQMIENALGAVDIPFGVATNFTINGDDVLVPMAIEEPSVIAAASNAARMAREGGGFTAETTLSYMAVQVEILEPQPGAEQSIRDARDEILALADATQPELVSLGGGAREIEVRTNIGGPKRLVVHLVVDCLDAMGANIVNTMGEAVSARLVDLAGGRAGLRILTNLADQRLARAGCRVPFAALVRNGFSGEQVARGIEAAQEFAAADPYRAATHNKGVFNGIDAVLVATGNDWRAVEAGGHAYAVKDGRYGPLTTWKIEKQQLVGAIELPMAVGVVGGAARIHPMARLAIELIGAERAAELAWVVAATGLASNLAALAALSTEGIQRGHMRLHHRKSSLEQEE